MFDSKKIYINGIQSVVYVKPPQNPFKRIYYGPRMRNNELVYFISSENITFFNGKKIYNKPGTLEYLPKLDHDVEYYVDRITPGDCIDIYFDTNYPLPTEAMNLDVSANKNINQLFLKVNQLWISKKDGYYYDCISLFYKILSEIEKSKSNYLPQSKYDKIKAGVDYITEHCFDEEFDYNMPCKLCGISYSYFKRLFIEKFAASPKEYITARRLERASELLSTEHYSITEISQVVGYSNVYYFSKIFKDHFGCPPSKYCI